LFSLTAVHKRHTRAVQPPMDTHPPRSGRSDASEEVRLLLSELLLRDGFRVAERRQSPIQGQCVPRCFRSRFRSVRHRAHRAFVRAARLRTTRLQPRLEPG
jgi:hypothetical protein